MKCPKCGSDVANGFKFCLNCGSPVERQAPAAQQQDDPELLKKINQIQKAAREAIQPSGGTEQEEPDRLDILAAGMASGEDKAPAAAGSAAEEHEPPRRSRRITPAAEPEKSEPVQAPHTSPRRIPVPKQDPSRRASFSSNPQSSEKAARTDWEQRKCFSVKYDNAFSQRVMHDHLRQD